MKRRRESQFWRKKKRSIDGGVGWAGSAVDVAVFGFGAAAMLEVSLSQLCCPHLDD
jgi:hypothetical protein